MVVLRPYGILFTVLVLLVRADTLASGTRVGQDSSPDTPDLKPHILVTVPDETDKPAPAPAKEFLQLGTGGIAET